MKTAVSILLLIFSFIVISCNKPTWQKTENNIRYQIFTNDTNKPKPIVGDHIWMHLRKYSPDKKELFNTAIFETENGVELDLKNPEQLSDVISFFNKLGIGDSAYIQIPKHLLDSTQPSKKYYGYSLKLLNFKPKAIYEEEQKIAYNLQIIKDSADIADYIQQNNKYLFMQDGYGNWYSRTLAKNGIHIQPNSNIKIHDIGKLLIGLEFDNSYEREKELDFIVGQKQVIEGLDKGIQNFFLGDKGILIIPSRLAYGNKSVGKIPTNSVLIFELEVLPN